MSPGRGLATLDLGNTNGKACLWASAGRASARIELRATFPTDASLPRGVREWLRLHDVATVAWCSVASPAIEHDLRAALAEVAREVVEPHCGLSSAAREPELVGRDRLFAARGALACLRASCVVVDAGTALTVDAVALEGGGGRFLGGSIAPGPTLLARALAQGTARLFEVEARADVHALGLDTREALEAGIVLGFRGAARELVDAVAREAGLPHAPIALTGGAAGLLAPFEPFTSRAIALPDLVHVGLAAAVLGDAAVADAR